jgi:regulatory protein
VAQSRRQPPARYTAVQASRSRGRRPPQPPNALDAALRLLGQRLHSELELRQKLRRYGCLPEEIDRALARVRELGYLDDAAFAHALVTHRARVRGPALIAAELAAKGVGRELAQAAVGSLDHEEVVAAARRLARRGGAADHRTIAARLFRRGFSAEIVREALGEPNLEER